MTPAPPPNSPEGKSDDERDGASEIAIGRKARYYAHIRDAHSTEVAEDYVEAIAELIESKGEARVADLARVFGVSHVTVSRTVGRLVRDGLANTEPYKSIQLSPKGRELAAACEARHEIVLRFLLALGLDNETAQIDAEGMEHHVSPKTLELFRRFTEQDQPRG